MHDSTLKFWLNSSFLTKNNQLYIDQIYEIFLSNPNLVDCSWYTIFQQWDINNKLSEKNQILSNSKISNKLLTKFKETDGLCTLSKKNNIEIDLVMLGSKISKLVNDFRAYGHQYAVLDPLNLSINNNKIKKNFFLELEYYEFSNNDLQQNLNTNFLDIPARYTNVQDIYNFLKESYCRTIGIEYTHILNIEQVLWIQNNFESRIRTYSVLGKKEQKQFLTEIIAAEELEHYLGIKFPGAKRFSLEGGDVLIPMLKEVIRYSVIHYNVQEVFFGMAHRGRLNTLINVLGKNPKDLINEFYDKKKENLNISGDVKYHQGLYRDMIIDNNPIHISLLFNPSHLEIITPVVLGSARARIDHLYKTKNIKRTIKNKNINLILPVVIHGDAAISGQGVVQESFNMANTLAYKTGGTLHIVINNQIGFTTSNIDNIRSTLYCTDIAKMIQVPIIHVNGDDLAAVIFAIRFALDFRNKFNHDIVIDLICYRRHGHNETDDPSVTQPVMYKKIRNHPTIVDIYSKLLIKNNIINIDEVNEIKRSYRLKLEKEDFLLNDWQPICTESTYYMNNFNNHIKNQYHSNIKKIDKKELQKIAYIINDIPSDIIMHDRVKKIYNDRLEMALGNKLFDWGGAETLAYATLLNQGYNIRLSGEDVARGTFFHRHAVIYNQNNNNKKYIPLMNIHKEQGQFFVWDSVLSEEAALAFEYGYSIMSQPNTLVIWEAQFGDFTNGAQVVIDQFISSSEKKWNQLCGLVMFLPHGYEGQGPEHSSCRIERYLQLCAEHNMHICVPSNPAQIYHILHQQANNKIQKPLIIVSPKSLLRHDMATSSIEDLIYGSFKTVINETNECCIKNLINRVIICTGKIYYDLINQRNQNNKYNIAIIRIEQLYPFPDLDFKKILQSYIQVKNFVWCQEEPKNQGAWYYIQNYFLENIPDITLYYIGRSESAAPAVGSFSIHQQQQKKIINNALNLN